MACRPRSNRRRARCTLPVSAVALYRVSHAPVNPRTSTSRPTMRRTKSRVSTLLAALRNMATIAQHGEAVANQFYFIQAGA